MLSERLRRNFNDTIDEELSRKIEFMLWVEPLSEARIIQILREETRGNVVKALKLLAKHQRVSIEIDKERRMYSVPTRTFRYVSEEWSTRLDGLENLVSNIANVIDARFFNKNFSFARTVSFRIREQDKDRLIELYEQTIWDALSTFDQLAEDAPDVTSIDLSIAWSPYNHILKNLKQNPKEENT